MLVGFFTTQLVVFGHIPLQSPSPPIITSYSVLLNALVYGLALLHPILVFTSEGGGHFNSGRVRRAVSLYTQYDQ